MKTTVLLVAYSGDSWLPGCLETLARASTMRLHLVLVDNFDNNIDRLDLSAFDTEVIKTPVPLGFAEANNYALVHARRLEETVLFLNQDTLSTVGWIDSCQACLDAAPEVGAISPLITTYDGNAWDPSFLDCAGSTEDLENTFSPETQAHFYVKNAPAPALLVRSKVLREVGPFDPVFGSYYEDYDLCRRIRKAGHQVAFCRRARLAHFSGSTTTTREKELMRMRQIIRNRLLYRLREAEGRRLQILSRYALLDFPRRFVRGLLRTSSSQPPGVVLKANLDLLRLGWRLVSQRRDEAAWRVYLAELGWTDRVADHEKVENGAIG